jgi:RNA polymerase sigma-70 factor (ECF subfamily)
VSRSTTPPSEGELSDAALVRLVADGDPRALEQLYDRYSRPAYALARRITGEAVFAEEVVQEVFLALWRDPSKYDPARGGFASWLLATTHHKSVDAVRREQTLRKRRAQAVDEADWFTNAVADTPAVEDEVWVGLRGERVRSALRTLPAPQREALTLAYFGGYTQREIATITETPLGTVKTRMLAGMRRLRDLLDGVADTSEGAWR